MIKIEHGNLSISGSGEETTADLLSVLTGYREMLKNRLRGACGRSRLRKEEERKDF